MLRQQPKATSSTGCYKPEHAVDLDTGVIVAAPIRDADKGDMATLDETLETAKDNLLDPRPCADP